MCGIFGYIGKSISFSSALEGLLRLEYRGYDSCGLVAIRNNKFFLKKRSGKINELKKELESTLKEDTSLCLLHTRWATHGAPNKTNAHPHLDCKKKIGIVHNGIIENFQDLKRELIKEGHRFLSDTDSEALAHLIEKCYKGSLEEAVFKAIRRLKGTFALGAVSLKEPDKLVVARKASPLIVGLGEQGNFLASDTPAILPFVKKVIYLKDEEVALIQKDKVRICSFKGKQLKPTVEKVNIKSEGAEKKGYEHFMLKEIYEQPKVLKKIISSYCKDGKINFSGFNFPKEYLKKVKKIAVVACGTAYHAGYVGKYFLERLSELEISIDTSSEFRYRNIKLDKNSLVIAISQSGETADTLAAVREAKKSGAKILSICNVLGSSLFKESDSVIFTLAGPEIGVASTKAYTAQTFCFYLFSLYLVKVKGKVKDKKIKEVLAALGETPRYQKKILRNVQKIKKIACRFSKYGSFLFLGRGSNYPAALEGALKLKEISYIPAEGYPAGEMKHGPIALIDEYRAIVCIAPKDNLYEKMVSNIQETKARKGKVLGILSEKDKEASSLSDAAIYIPKVANQDINPFLVAVPLQLFAYFVAKNLRCEIDQPRNLAKSVTVE